jgi:hypothetical protein
VAIAVIIGVTLEILLPRMNWRYFIAIPIPLARLSDSDFDSRLKLTPDEFPAKRSKNEENAEQ